MINAIEKIDLVGPISAAMLRNLPRSTAIGMLSLNQAKGTPYPGQKITEAIARGLANIHSLERLWLWLDTTPAALRHVFTIPKLRVLDLLNVVYPGRLVGFAASEIEEFRSNCGLRESDLLEISRSTSLKQLGAQSSELSMRSMTALMAMPKLQALNLEVVRVRGLSR